MSTKYYWFMGGILVGFFVRGKIHNVATQGGE